MADVQVTSSVRSERRIPRVREDLVFSGPDAEGVSVVRHRGRYMRLGRQETFLLNLFDGKATYSGAAERYRDEFREEISVEELREFAKDARKAGLLCSSRDRAADPETRGGLRGFAGQCFKQARQQSPLFFRVKLVDPNALLDWLEPRTRWLFSAGLAVFAAVAGLMAIATVWLNRTVLYDQVTSQFGWQALCMGFAVTILVTIAHEFGHGLACKRYGGDVHEMGFLWIFFTPCLYCNVSDAWMLPDRWRRVLIGLAGTYVDFLTWIVAVAVWRVTDPSRAVNFAAWIVVTTCGLRVAFNLNPLMRLDGYYALADILGVHNLRKRARARWLAHGRWLLWGGARPAKEPQGRILLAYGAANWLFAVGFLAFLSFELAVFVRPLFGIGGMLAGCGVFAMLTRRYFRGSLGEEFRSMFLLRRKRLLAGAIVVVVVAFIPIYDKAGAEFHIRPALRQEVRAPVAGFLREIHADQGDLVSEQGALVRIEIPELRTQVAIKRSEIAESEAVLRRLRAGTRIEEITDQKERIARAARWRDLAEADLVRARRSFAETTKELQLDVDRSRQEVEYREAIFQQMKKLHDEGGLAGSQLLIHERNFQDARLEMRQAEARLRARTAEGVLKYESELALREKELEDARGTLTLMEAGTRSEDLEAEVARHQRLCDELAHLEAQEAKQEVFCPVNGTIVTPRFREKVGTFVDKGTPLCVVEDLNRLEAEIEISEQDARVLVPGHLISLKPRSLPFDTILARVDRIAPVAQPAEGAGPRTITVYCRVENASPYLRGGMSGYARIRSEKRCLGILICQSLARLVRTEFFW